MSDLKVDSLEKSRLEKDSLISRLGVSNPGTRFKTNINYSYDSKTGDMIPNFDEQIDFYDFIQSSKNSCDINVIVERAKMGDISVLNVNVPHYGDFSEIPTDLNTRYKLNRSLDDDWTRIQYSGLKDVFSSRDDFEKAVIDNTYMTRINDFISKNSGKKDGDSNE